MGYVMEWYHCRCRIYKVAMNKHYAKQLTEAGKKQLQTYDNYEQRADKLVRILEGMVKESSESMGC